MPKSEDSVLILTPIKDAADCFESYCRLLDRLSYPPELISIGLLESDSRDASWEVFETGLPRIEGRRKESRIWKRDFGFQLPPGVPRWAPPFQIARRAVISKSRNHLLSRALGDQAWVLWIDVDVVEAPADIIETFLATGRDLVHPHCLHEHRDETFDLNAWRDQGRLHLSDLRQEGDLVRLDAVGGTMLWVRADLHRDGLIFPSFPYGAANPAARDPGPWGVKGELDTEGLGILALDMGIQPWGMPNVVIRHRNA
ncbi:MAG: hypothetical protein AAF657_10810 [Acidobacteriota bacterium]